MINYDTTNMRLRIKMSTYGTDEDLYHYDKPKSLYSSSLTITPLSREHQIIAQGFITGEDARHFVIVNNGKGFPVAYISLFDDDYICQLEPPENVDRSSVLENVHGGGTYMGGAYWDLTDDGKYIGWDYCHADDYHASADDDSDLDGKKKWSIFEIMNDAVRAAEQLWDMNKHPEKYARFTKEPKPTLTKIIKEIEDYIASADRVSTNEDEFTRGWKCALLTALEIVTKYERNEKEENENEDH